MDRVIMQPQENPVSGCAGLPPMLPGCSTVLCWQLIAGDGHLLEGFSLTGGEKEDLKQNGHYSTLQL